MPVFPSLPCGLAARAIIFLLETTNPLRPLRTCQEAGAGRDTVGVMKAGAHRNHGMAHGYPYPKSRGDSRIIRHVVSLFLLLGIAPVLVTGDAFSPAGLPSVFHDVASFVTWHVAGMSEASRHASDTAGMASAKGKEGGADSSTPVGNAYLSPLTTDEAAAYETVRRDVASGASPDDTYPRRQPRGRPCRSGWMRPS